MLKLILSTLALALLISAVDAQKKVSGDEFSQQALMAHNAYRRIHGVNDLKLNDELTSLAMKRAHEMATNKRLSVKKSQFQNETVGESVGAVGGFFTYNGISATELWYCVLPSFDSEGETNKEGASFTQMVWKNTREVGFGISVGPDNKFYFAAEYFPSGNVAGQFGNNVFQIGDAASGNDNKTNTTTSKPKHDKTTTTTTVASITAAENQQQDEREDAASDNDIKTNTTTSKPKHHKPTNTTTVASNTAAEEQQQDERDESSSTEKPVRVEVNVNPTAAISHDEESSTVANEEQQDDSAAKNATTTTTQATETTTKMIQVIVKAPKKTTTKSTTTTTTTTPETTTKTVIISVHPAASNNSSSSSNEKSVETSTASEDQGEDRKQ